MLPSVDDLARDGAQQARVADNALSRLPGLYSQRADIEDRIKSEDVQKSSIEAEVGANGGWTATDGTVYDTEGPNESTRKAKLEYAISMHPGWKAAVAEIRTNKRDLAALAGEISTAEAAIKLSQYRISLNTSIISYLTVLETPLTVLRNG